MLIEFAIIFEMLIFENTRFRGVLDITAHYFYNDQKLLCIVLKKKSTAVCTPSFTGKQKYESTSSEQEHLKSQNFMKLSCHALNETLNSIKENINVLNRSLIPF